MPPGTIILLGAFAGLTIYLGLPIAFLKAPELMMWGLFIGFLLGYATDLIVTFAGA